MMNALETVKAYYAAFNRQDFDGMLALLDEGVRHEPNQGEPRIGIDLFKEFLGHMDESYTEQLTDMVFLTEPSDRLVACQFVVNGIYKKGEEGLPEARGQSYVLPAASFVEVRNGKIVRVATHYNLPYWIQLVSA